MTMSSDPDSRVQWVQVVTCVQRRRRWSVGEKVRLVEEAMQPGLSVSYVARRAGIAPSQLFAWKRRMLEGGATAVQADDDLFDLDIKLRPSSLIKSGVLPVVLEKEQSRLTTNISHHRI